MLQHISCHMEQGSGRYTKCACSAAIGCNSDTGLACSRSWLPCKGRKTVESVELCSRVDLLFSQLRARHGGMESEAKTFWPAGPRTWAAD